MNRKIVGVLAALLLAMIGTLLIVGYVRGIEGRALADERRVPVLVVQQAIPEGATAGEIAAAVDLEQVPAKVRAEGAVDKLGDLEGLVAAVDLVPGEQITKARFLTPAAVEEEQGVKVPEGLLEVTISLEASRVVGGKIKPGDVVAVVGSFSEGASDGEEDAGKADPTTHVLLHKVLVTEIGTEGQMAAAEGQQAPDAAAAPVSTGAPILVTLALDAPSVERVVHTAEFGKLWLASEPEDAPEKGTRIQSLDTIYEKSGSDD